MKGKSSILSRNSCYGLPILMAALDSIIHPSNSQCLFGGRRYESKAFDEDCTVNEADQGFNLITPQSGVQLFDHLATHCITKPIKYRLESNIYKSWKLQKDSSHILHLILLWGRTFSACHKILKKKTLKIPSSCFMDPSSYLWGRGRHWDYSWISKRLSENEIKAFITLSYKWYIRYHTGQIHFVLETFSTFWPVLFEHLGNGTSCVSH